MSTRAETDRIVEELKASCEAHIASQIGTTKRIFAGIRKQVLGYVALAVASTWWAVGAPCPAWLQILAWEFALLFWAASAWLGYQLFVMWRLDRKFIADLRGLTEHWVEVVRSESRAVQHILEG